MDKRLLYIIGVETDKNEDFQYKRASFKYISDIPLDFKQILSDIRCGNRDFVLKFVESYDVDGKITRELGIILDENTIFSNKYESRIRLLTLIFSDIKSIPLKLCSNQLLLNKNSAQVNSKYVTSKLYDLLHKHIPENNDTNIIDVIKSSFNLILKPYQINSVLWLVDREINTVYLQHDFFPVTCKLNGKTFYINSRNLEIQFDKPDPFPIPTGGILADEMGLGKTLEMLALIIFNKRTNISNPILNTIINNQDVQDQVPKKRTKLSIEEKDIFCLCANNNKDTDFIACAQCKLHQHKKCVRKYSKNENNIYLCPRCWLNISVPIKSGTTIIVTPDPIKMQWFSEIKKHVQCELKVFLYNGVSAGWISPFELAEYDIVLTDYNILRREIDFSTENQTNIEFRKRKKYFRVNSPLVLVEWWRVCLDEAQMVESTKVKAAQMVKTLPAVHRWAITGTPINKSIDDLYGLIDFLDMRPLCKQNVWKSFVSEFLAGETESFVNVFQKIMWRTSKSTVEEELNIPYQKEKVHFIEMSDAQKFFYKDQHIEKSHLFEARLKNMFSSNNTKISQIDPRELNIILEPLKKLRQDCTVPVLTKKNERNYKKLLQPKELMTHLIATNEMECKSCLRSLASSYNGLAALYFIRKNYEKAIYFYKMVLKLAEENTGNVCVDSLLQIHALHNYILANEEQKENFEKKCYTEQLTSLINKYLVPYAANLKNSSTELNSFYESINELLNVDEAGELPVIWWPIYEYKYDPIIQTDLCNRLCEDPHLYARCENLSISTLAGALFCTENWLSGLIEMRNDLNNYFKNFKIIIDNVKSKEELQPNQIDFIDKIILEICECHLNKPYDLIDNNEPKCRLCSGKNMLNRYECQLFQKTIDGTGNTTEGTWRPSCHEEIMKIIILCVKKKRPAVYCKRMNKPLELVNVLKNEFKEMTKLWIELDYALKAYDELEMCKMRLQVVSTRARTAFEILEDCVDKRFADHKSDVVAAEGDLYRANSRLNYIKRLNINENPGLCPICQMEIYVKYAVWQCGHHLCCSCMDSMIKYLWKKRNFLVCPICRHEQAYSEIHFVHLAVKLSTNTSIKGDFSGKVEEIVRTVLKLKQEDKYVKILVFSHWDSILGVISKAFSENDISYRVKRTTKSLEEFKNNSLDVTCMLLLLHHGAKGLNLTEATHVFFVEPLLNPGEEAQAIGRIHRLGQTKPTTVHRFIVKGTIEEQIYKGITSTESKWDWNDLTFERIQSLFSLPNEDSTYF